MSLNLFTIILSSVLLGCTHTRSRNEEERKPVVKIERTKAKAADALAFCNTRSFNTDFCILIDMSLHSGVERFFVWDFNKDTITKSFLVGHGCCDNPWSLDFSKDKPAFSNKDGSHCTALGKYRIGARGYSDWGINIKYLIHGLEPTNNNSLARTIVFHSWDKVSDKEVYPDGTPEGWGCPTISNNSLRAIDPLLKTSQKPVLMWIYK
jgi:hypothetical protein